MTLSKTDVDVKVNEAITARDVRVIDEDGKQLGVVSRHEALGIARSRGYDLVEMNGTTEPVVCRLINYDKYRYELSRKQKEQKKKQVVVETKEVKFRPQTDKNDLNVKINQIRKFVSQNKKVKLTLQFSGREVECSRDIGFDTFSKVLSAVADVGVVLEDSRLSGKYITALVGPK